MYDTSRYLDSECDLIDLDCFVVAQNRAALGTVGGTNDPLFFHLLDHARSAVVPDA